MKVRLHPHARERLAERGTTEREVIETVQTGERFPAKFRQNRLSAQLLIWRRVEGPPLRYKQVETYAVEEDGWVVITVIVRYF